ncbi:MAG: MFS transporter [Dehalococcoidales bacterium]|nr:MFS transporter [Dehalococcoidales bacterium]
MTRFKPPSWVSISLCLAAINLLTNCAVETSNVFIALYAQEQGATNFEVGLMAAAGGISFLVASLLFGRLSDIHGRLSYIRIGLGMTALAYLTQLLAQTPMALVAARALIGFALGINSSAIMAFTYENQRQIGSFISYGALGWLIGALIALVVKSYNGLFIVSSVLTFLAFLISFLLQEKTVTRMRVSLFPVNLIKADYKIYLAFFLRQLGGNAIWAIWPLYQAGIGATKVWIALTEVTNMVGQIIFMRIVERFNPARMFQIGLLISAGVFIAYGLANQYWQLIPIQLVLAFAYSSMFVGALSYLLRRHPEYGTTSGLLNSVNAMSGIFGPFIGGGVSQAWNYSTLMYVGAGITLLGSLTARNLKVPKTAEK